MPIYNFRCNECGKHFERIVKRDEVNQVECEACNKADSVELMMSVFGSYSIKGNNSASITPKKFRGGK